ncbi:choline dehydrogenase [Pseudorhodoferax aquiterrae]|uniref:Choline dehydrogenase n=1 Tax=Pseudorhodoferax aquiterrae TaxID=747304 RepID=A0ABQ3FYS8_9BURK|nr:choline dehydrogenase [Pseudorhodoferax aquiterrae]GHC77418.1 choline dehydrogenase [Pseudorhodoferax aquiterrae]
MSEVFDHIVVGAGSAGCVLAARLSEDPGTRVLLLEAGPPDRSPWIHLPIGYGKTMWSPAVNWCYHTDPDPNMNGRRIYWPRGKTLGGSSSINGLIYIRGQQEDYDHWAALGNTGWSYEEVLPYFVKSECNQRGAIPLHGDAGPLRVSDIGARHPLIEAFIAGAGEIGVPRTDDFNGARQEGAGYYQLTTHRGLRVSAAKAYLKPARGRPNLRVETGAFAAGVLMEGKRAVGVRWRQNGVLRAAKCRGEVLLAAGALQSPQLLQLSGIGPAALLAEHGIPLVHDAPGVGENLQDHLQIRLIYECTKPITTNDQLRSVWGQARLGLQWLLARSGPLAVGINQGGCFMRALRGPDGLPVATTPDIQFHVATLSADMAGGKVHPFSGFTLSVCQLRPESRGRVRIRSADPFEPPSMQPNYLATALDRRTAVAGMQAARAIAAAPSMRPYVRREVKPGPDAADEAALLAFCRDHGATIFHPSGTCRMGVDAGAVLDPRLRVRGTEALRVVDCSAMPTLVSGNTHAPAVMMAEKAVDMIREDARRRP